MTDLRAVANPFCPVCADLLHEALDLTLRGRTLDGIQKRQANLDASVDPDAWQRGGRFDAYVAMHNADAEPWNMIETRSLTPRLWAEDQFASDLYDWEQRARKHMKEMHP